MAYKFHEDRRKSNVHIKRHPIWHAHWLIDPIAVLVIIASVAVVIQRYFA